LGEQAQQGCVTTTGPYIPHLVSEVTDGGVLPRMACATTDRPHAGALGGGGGNTRAMARRESSTSGAQERLGPASGVSPDRGSTSSHESSMALGRVYFGLQVSVNCPVPVNSLENFQRRQPWRFCSDETRLCAPGLAHAAPCARCLPARRSPRHSGWRGLA